MYQIIKVLNNNAILAYHNENERILLGKGIGFGKSRESGLKRSTELRFMLWKPERSRVLRLMR